MRLVKPAVILYEKNGQMVREPVAIQDRNFATAQDQEKARLIEYVKGMRLVVWLLERQSRLSSAELSLSRTGVSNLMWQASLTSTWNLWFSFATIEGFPGMNRTLDSLLHLDRSLAGLLPFLQSTQALHLWSITCSHVRYL